jgi:fermentation-respiration switch protein FrsA (DUF1100 family)
LIERRFIFFPEGELLATPADVGLEFEDLRFSAADGAQLHGWLVPGAGESSLLWFHGNAGNVGDRVPLLKELHQQLAVSILILEYRGYGASEGRPSEGGLYLDAEAALGALTARMGVEAGSIVLFGQSLGAAVAVELARRRPPLGLILESAFTSVAEMARHHYPWLPVGGLLRTRFDSLSKISAVQAPLLVIHGDRDEIAPLDMGKALFAAAPGRKRLLVLRGAGHNDLPIVAGDAYFAALRGFLADQ